MKRHLCLDSRAGVELLESCGASRLKALRLLTHLEGQHHRHACGLASAVTMLNALGAASPISPGHAPQRLFTQERLEHGLPSLHDGMTLDELADLLRGQGLTVQIERAKEDPQALLAKARQVLESRHGMVIANLHAGTLYEDDGPGHFSPLGACHADQNRWLLLDVARHRYRPAWITGSDLWQAMATTDRVTNQRRGMLFIDGSRLDIGLGQLIKGEGPIVAAAIHAGHELRLDVAAFLALDEETRRREEDPYTERIVRVSENRIELQRSRFEVDVNRPRANAVYRTPEEAWGLHVWREALPEALIQTSLELYDRFYHAVEAWLEDLVSEYGGFVILDVHSYNHRRRREVADPALNPEIDIGTGSLDRQRWAPLIDRFIAGLRRQTIAGHAPDVRENVKWPGIEFARRIHQRFPTGCLLTIECKKTFMDEWTGELDEAHLADLGRALSATFPGLGQSLADLTGL